MIFVLTIVSLCWSSQYLINRETGYSNVLLKHWQSLILTGCWCQGKYSNRKCARAAPSFFFSPAARPNTEKWLSMWSGQENLGPLQSRLSENYILEESPLQGLDRLALWKLKLKLDTAKYKYIHQEAWAGRYKAPMCTTPLSRKLP